MLLCESTQTLSLQWKNVTSQYLVTNGQEETDHSYVLMLPVNACTTCYMDGQHADKQRPNKDAAQGRMPLVTTGVQGAQEEIGAGWGCWAARVGNLQLLEKLLQLVLQGVSCGLTAASREEAAKCPRSWLLLNEALHIPQHKPAKVKHFHLSSNRSFMAGTIIGKHPRPAMSGL